MPDPADSKMDCSDAGPGQTTPALRAALVGTAILSMAVVILGGFETNVRLWAKLDPAHVAFAQSALMTRGPRSVAELLLAVLFVVGWFAWQPQRAQFAQRGYARKGVVVSLVAASLLAGALAGASGFAGITGTGIAAWHAIVGHMVFACIAAATVFAVGGAPDASPKIAIGGGFPLRGLALWLPLLVATQVAMGAAYRHGQWGILPHLAGAMVVAFLLVAESVLLLQRVPDHRLLRRAAHWALGAVLLQVALGVSDYLVRLLDFQDTTVWFVLSLAHVTVGSITFAGSLYLAISVHICVMEA